MKRTKEELDAEWRPELWTMAIDVDPGVAVPVGMSSEDGELLDTAFDSGGKSRTFDTGATRDTDEGKYDYEGFLSPLVIERFGQYMDKHRHQSDGNLRASDNWQKGIPQDQYMKSGWRLFMYWWLYHRECYPEQHPADTEEALCALMFNVMGYLHEHLKGKDDD